MKNRYSWLLCFVAMVFLVACSSFSPAGENDSPLPAMGKPSYEGLAYSDEQILVRYNCREELSDYLSDHNSQIIETFAAIDWALITVPADKTALAFVDELEEQNIVLMAEPNLRWELPEPAGADYRQEPVVSESDPADYGRLWGMPFINADKAWESTTGDENVIIAIIDTGLDLEHPEFLAHTIIAPHNGTDDGWTGGVKDVHGHGTHVAGTAAANGRSEKLAGVAWDCPIMPIRVMDIDGFIETNYLIDAMLYVADYVLANPHYRAVVNMSIGGRGYSYSFKDAIDYAQEAGVLLVAAAGNDYKRVISYPAAYNGVVSVAAVDPQGQETEFSSRGFWNSVAAPGIRIWSAIPTYATGVYQPYAEMAGTSMAAPHVCGAAALLLSQDSTLTPLAIKNQLEETARPGFYGEGFNEKVGYGILDVEALLGPLAPMKYGSLKVETDVVYGLVTIFDDAGNMRYFGATGNNKDHNFHAVLPGRYTVTLSYGNKVHDQKEVAIQADEETLLNLWLGN